MSDCKMEPAVQSFGCGGNSALVWRGQVLTGAAQPLLPEPQQQALAHVAVNRLVEMLHPPEVLPVRLGHLVVTIYDCLLSLLLMLLLKHRGEKPKLCSELR